ncbi:glucokinase [Azotobacter beijerinckii]|uniref:Glucokinase n=1 Tax=Azotobacter beijerinckii TaxID=170623 RepID=A0A1H6YDJ1_9GAMM|nr:glucokinase [Azotobacter beijerinckii]SEJ39338.1 glucokinase [Azotobacter beijerinckii]SER54851.1 glucokinase [Azotobacter beijerinckii]
MKLALVGDIGGTNARFALWINGQIESVKTLAAADFASPELAIEHYLSSLGLAPDTLSNLCLGCAGPVSSEDFRFTNNHWTLNRTAFRQALQLDNLILINDFTAMALGMTRLHESERIQICPGVAESGRPSLVIGPGTGLGVSTLLPDDKERWKVLSGEGGHVDLPIGSLREAALWQQLFGELGHVRAEDILSGSGLTRLYRSICALDKYVPHLSTPAEISAAALAGDPVAKEVLSLFCIWLGRVTGNNVLTMGARGGVYIVGGVIPRFAAFFQSSGFADSLCHKGSMSHYLKGVPVWLVTAEYPGLEGAGVALQQMLEPTSNFPCR